MAINRQDGINQAIANNVPMSGMSQMNGIINTALTGNANAPVPQQVDIQPPIVEDMAAPTSGAQSQDVQPQGGGVFSNASPGNIETFNQGMHGAIDAWRTQSETAAQAQADTQSVTEGAYEVASAVDQVVGITPQTIEGESYQPVEVAPAVEAETTGYEATGYQPTLAPEAEGYEAKGYEAQGYEALQGVAKTTAENVSQAIQRITGADSPIMQRAVAQATAEANRRGLLNSSMAAGAAQGAILDRAREIAQGDIQAEQFNVAQQNAMESQNIQMANDALRFTADAKNQASAFLAGAQNRAAEFLAAERNQNGRFNAEQSNRAAEFSANAQNQASQFLAAAQNQASIFNAGEANRLSMFTAEQANTAARFAAEMSQAASQFNATAFNQAEQRYADAMNAAIMAQTDAENQSRRDLAVFRQQAEQNALDRQNRLAAAEISAGASVAAAGISASASLQNAEANRQFQAGQAALDREFRAQENAATREFNQQQMGVQAYNTFVSQVGQVMQNTNLTDEGRQNAVSTLMSLHNGHPNAQVNISIGGGP